MIVCVHGIDFRNYGALMMLEAVRRAASRMGGSTRICVPFTDGRQKSRAHLGVDTALLTTRFRHGMLPVGGLMATRIAGLIPATWRKRRGMVLAGEIDAHFDASGFAYGDPWGPRRTLRRAMLARTWVRHGQPLIVLPQAFGPFLDPGTATACRQYLAAAQLVYARDESSLKHLQGLGVDQDRILIAPDFTLDGDDPLPDWNPNSSRVAIVPNMRFIDMAGEGPHYLDLMVRCAEMVKDHGLEPEIVLHEENDAGIGTQIAQAAECAIRPPSGYGESASILSEYRFVISCRYHALVASLGAGVPALAIGWTHKYRGLMRDFGVESFCCDPGNPAAIQDCVNRLSEDANQIRPALIAGRTQVLHANEEMWRTVWAEIATRRTRPRRAHSLH